ncbi:hypothetical protein VZT92_016260 [Zoarces viviparus]|uniref:Uncharacterized protein n=1 Tax=Zoarces viviparus TaxID=48416 RepID=A0AAW1ET59_ZOAVI
MGIDVANDVCADEYKSRCQYQCACQRSKTSKPPDGENRKRSDIAGVDGEAKEPRAVIGAACVCIKEPVRVASTVPACLPD